MNHSLFQNLLYGWSLIAITVFFLLLKITAPYGRHSSAKWGPQVNNRTGWVVMEIPALLLLLSLMFTYLSKQNVITWIMAGLFLLHYLNRTLIYPFRTRTKGKKIPLIIVLSGFFFNFINVFFLGYYFAHFSNYVRSFLFDVHFIAGILIFATGMFINWKYDGKLIRLRQSSGDTYKIPRGGLFERVSCPNLFGEIIEWVGYAVLCWNLPALSFLVWTLANLIPRGIAHHKWYLREFENYPAKRKAIFPFFL